MDDGHPNKLGVVYEVLERHRRAGGIDLSSNHNCCLYAGPPPFGRRAAPVNLIGAAEAKSPQGRPSVKAMSSHVLVRFHCRSECCLFMCMA
jgi:hypothetical protein